MSEQVPISGAGDDFGRALGALLRSYREKLSPILVDCPHGERGYQILCEVVRRSRPSQLALANHLGIDRTVMTYLIDDLVEAGLVERRPNPDDRRQRLIVATPLGEETLARYCDRVLEVEAETLSRLDADEQALFRRLLEEAVAGA